CWSPLAFQRSSLAPRPSWHLSDSLPASRRPDSPLTAQCPFLAPRTSWHPLDSLPTSRRPDSSPTAQCPFLAPRTSWHLLDSFLQGSSLRHLAAQWSTFPSLLQRPSRRTHLACRLPP